MCDFMFYVNSTDGVKIAVYDYNCGGTETVLLVHGWPLSHKIYEYQIPILVRMGYRVVALDLRGFGMSDVPGCGYSYDQMAADIHQVVKRLRLWSFTLVGFSMGGAISLRYMRLFRGYEEKEKNRGILDYVAAGWNRDGLALRAAGHLAGQSSCEKRLLLSLIHIFSDTVWV